MEKVRIIAFANDHNEPMLLNLIKSLKKYNYDYDIIGQGVKWTGFMTKINGYLNYISGMKNNQIIAIVDAYDVIVCGSSDQFISKYKSYGKPLVIGSETFCGCNCIPVDNWWHTNSSTSGRVKKGQLQYVNSGFCVGTVKSLKKALNFMLELGIGDDQEALCTYVNKYPEEVALDTNAYLVANITQFEFGYLDFREGRIYNKLTGNNPLFVHTPGKTGDFMIRSNYVGSRILGDEYVTTPYSETASCALKKIPMVLRKGYKIITPIIVLFLIIVIILAIYNPKLLGLFLLVLFVFIILFIMFYSVRYL
jgi:hypothetical protein